MSIDLECLRIEEYEIEMNKENISPGLSRQSSKNSENKSNNVIQRAPFSDLTELFYPKKIQKLEEKSTRVRQTQQNINQNVSIRSLRC